MSTSITDAKGLELFCDYMNKKAAELGMTNTVFRDPTGVDNYSTSSDIMKCLLWATDNKKLHEIWKLPDYTADIKGENPRLYSVISLSKKGENCQYLTDHYEVIVGKGGTLLIPKIYNSAMLVKMPEEGSRDALACVIMGADVGRLMA